jgi:hypothetical protein
MISLLPKRDECVVCCPLYLISTADIHDVSYSRYPLISIVLGKETITLRNIKLAATDTLGSKALICGHPLLLLSRVPLLPVILNLSLE